MGGSAPPPPDYSQMAAATKYSADLSYKLGEQQIQQAQAQYDQMWPYVQQSLQTQQAAQQQGMQESAAYFNNWSQNAPALQQQVATENSQAYDKAMQQLQAIQSSPYLQTMTGSDAQVYGQQAANINPMVDNAIATARGLTTNNMEQAVRSGLRYGLSADANLMNTGSLGLGAASNEVAAGNQALQQGITNARNQAATGYNAMVQQYGLNQQATQQQLQNNLNLVNTYSGLPANTTSALNAASNAGTVGIQSANQTNSVLNSATNQGNTTQMQGAQTQVNGLGAMLNGQMQYDNLVAGVNNANTASTASLAGTAIGAAVVL